jgi:DNA-directed RNA polymerase subunit E'/Rpb7
MELSELTQVKNIIVRFCLKPEYLDSHYKEHLFRFIQKQYEKKCFQDHGYIYKVIGLSKILKEEIMSIVPNNYFILEVSVCFFYPKIGQQFSIKIDRIFAHGIFFWEDMIRILVPLSMCSSCVIDKDFSSYYVQHTTTQQIFRKNDTVKIELVDVRFEKDGFSCIGKLIFDHSQ